MKYVLYLILFASLNLSAQEDIKPNAFLGNPEYRTVYSGYPNYFEYTACNCDSIIITSLGAEIESKETYGFYLIPPTNQREIIVSVNCITGRDTAVSSWKYNVRTLPNPSIYLGGINLQLPIDQVPESSFFAQERFSARYDEHVPLTNVAFTIKEWSITIGKNTFVGHSPKLTEDYTTAYLNAKRKTKVVINYAIVDFPDGTTKKIILNTAYTKKSKRNGEIKVENKNRYVVPESGG